MTEVVEFAPTRERIMQQQRRTGYQRSGLSIEQLLHGGVVTMAYQPQYDLNSGVIRGVEALLRVTDAHRQNINPGTVVRQAEQAGLIDTLGFLVLVKSCEDFIAIKTINKHVDRLAVNVNPLELRQANYAELVSQAVAKSGIAFSDLELEITEGWSLDDPDLHLDQLQTLANLGVHITLDDFGSGHANWSNVLKLPISTVKIDRALIEQITDCSRVRGVVSSICRACGDMGLNTLAEGVCNAQQRELLLSMGCLTGQGFGLSLPLPPDELLDLKPQNLANLSNAERL